MDITRYGVVVEKIEQDGMLKTVVGYMTPKEGGEFIRYNDHMEIMEAIGAGGVSGRITSKTLEQHRAEFEEAKYKAYRTGHGVFGPWEAWAAARGVKE